MIIDFFLNVLFLRDHQKISNIMHIQLGRSRLDLKSSDLKFTVSLKFIEFGMKRKNPTVAYCRTKIFPIFKEKRLLTNENASKHIESCIFL